MRAQPKPAWRCPKCGRAFVARNLVHSCELRRVDDHFRGRPRAVVALYRQFTKRVRACGQVMVLPQKTSIAFQARTSFAWVRLLRDALGVGLLLPRLLSHPRITNVQSGSPRSYLYHFRVSSAEDLKGKVAEWIREAYRVGMQLHLREPQDEFARERFEDLRRRAGRTPKLKGRPLWRCPKCGKYYVTRNIWHACTRHTEEEHFRGSWRRAVPTNLAIDDALLNEALRIGRKSTKRETVNEALREYIRFRKRLKALKLFGKIDFDPRYNHKAARRKR